jgi:hypothetical protein
MGRMRTRVILPLIAALAVVAGSFGVAAAGEREQAYVVPSEDCGCTGAARAQDRVERGLIPTDPGDNGAGR